MHCHYSDLAGASIITSGFTYSFGQMWLDDVQCVGNESRLIDCPARPLGQHSCFYYEVTGVSCSRMFSFNIIVVF